MTSSDLEIIQRKAKKAMMEFGEKLKKAREEKGMTQQTLADQLYVTRQAVSRWECGARYPDLLTAKRISDVLQVSLDELLSGEEIKRCVEKNPIVESPVMGRIQASLYAFAGIEYFFMSVLTMRFLLPGLAVADWQTKAYALFYVLKYMLPAVLLFAGLVFSICGRLTPKKAGTITAAYFGMELFSRIFVSVQMGNTKPIMLQSLLYLLCMGITVGYYFRGKSLFLFPMYGVAAFGLIRNIAMYRQMMQFESDFAFIVRSLWLAATAGYMALIAYQAYELGKKRQWEIKALCN